MALLDSSLTFLAVCQVTTDFSDYHNNESDEIHAVFCRTPFPADMMTNDCVKPLTAQYCITQKSEMPSKVKISCWHWRHWKGNFSVSAIVLPTQEGLGFCCMLWEMFSELSIFNPWCKKKKKHYVTGLFSTVSDQGAPTLKSQAVVVVFTALMPASQYQADFKEMTSPVPFLSLTLSIPLSLLYFS